MSAFDDPIFEEPQFRDLLPRPLPMVPPEVVDAIEDDDPAVRFSPSAHVFGRPEYLDDSRLTQEAIDYEAQAVEEDAERMAGLRAGCFVAVCIGAVITFGFGWAAVELIAN